MEVPRNKGDPEQVAMRAGWGLGWLPEEVTPELQAGQEPVTSFQPRPPGIRDPEPTLA